MAILVNVQIVGLRDLRGRFARYNEELARYRTEEAEAYVPKFVAKLSQHAPVGETAKFKDSFHGKVTRTERGSQVKFFSRDPRAKYIIEPTPPHTITAVRSKFMRFMVGDEKVFAKVVHHPGTKGSDFAVKAFVEMREEFIRQMNRAGVRAVVFLAGRR